MDLLSPQFIIPFTILIVINIAALLFINRKKPGVHIFNSIGGQDFNESIRRFKSLSPRAQATFIYRFTDSLNAESFNTLRKYIQKRLTN